MQAQNREGLILDMTQWMVEMNDLLQSRIDADILAGDVPEEYEVAVCHFPISRFSVFYFSCPLASDLLSHSSSEESHIK